MALDLEPVLDLEPIDGSARKLDLEPIDPDRQSPSARAFIPEPGSDIPLARQMPNAIGAVPTTQERVGEAAAQFRAEQMARDTGDISEIGSGAPITIGRFGKPGTMTRGASDVMGGLVEWALNKPEEALATLTPLAPAIAARYAPEIAVQFGKDVVSGIGGDREAMGRAITMGALVGGPKAFKEAQARYLLSGEPKESLPGIDFESTGRMTPRPILKEPSPAEPSPVFATDPESVRVRNRIETGEEARAVSKLEKPVVPEKGETGRPTAVEEIRQANAKTKAEIQKVFPGISREQAGELRKAAWPEVESIGAAPMAEIERLLPQSAEAFWDLVGQQSGDRPIARERMDAIKELLRGNERKAATTEEILGEAKIEPAEEQNSIPKRESEAIPPGDRPQSGQEIRAEDQAPKEEIASTSPPPESEVKSSGGTGQLPEPEAPTDPAIIGMGGATPIEFKAAPNTTGIKNARIDLQREQRGLPPLTSRLRQTWQEAWEKSMARMDEDPQWQDRLISELRENPRPASDVETVALLQRMTDLRNEIDKARRSERQAYADGRVEDAAINRRIADDWRSQLASLEQTVRDSATEKGKALASQKMMMAEDYTLAKMETDLLSAKKGERLTDSELDQVKRLQSEIESLQAKLDAKERELEGKVDRTRPRKGATEEERLAAAKNRMRRETDKLENKTAYGDASGRTAREPIKLDREGLELAFRLKKAKEKWMELVLREKLKHEELNKRVLRKLFEGSAIVRSWLTALDLSAVLRQGKFAVLQHPIIGARAIGPMLKAFASEKAAFAVEHDIATRPNAQRYSRAGLALTDAHSPVLSRMEEAFMGRLVGKIPGVSGSARAYSTFLNKLRADAFDALTATIGEGTPNGDKVIANAVNVFTGRGSIPFQEQAAVGLNAFFFAPRFVASRFQAMLGQPLYYGAVAKKVGFEGSGKARALVAGEYAKLLAGYAVIYGLAQATGLKIGTDSNSTDFGKIIIGKTRLDPLAGVSQVSVLVSRLITGKKTTLAGKSQRIRGNVPYGGDTAASVIGGFLRQKLAPVPQLFMDVTTGKFVGGEKVTKEALANHYIVPISFQDVLDTMKEQGIPAGTALEILSVFGENVNTYEDRRHKK